MRKPKKIEPKNVTSFYFWSRDKKIYLYVYDLVAVEAPIANEEVEFGFGFWEGDGNDVAVVDSDGAKSAGGFLEVD